MDTMTFVLFGATGDLAKRKIFPAFYNLFLDQKLPDTISIIGAGRGNMSDSAFQHYVEEAIITFSRRSILDCSSLKKFIESIRYCSLDAVNTKDYKVLLQMVKQREEELNIPENRMFYLSVAPKFFDVIASNIKVSGLGSAKGWKRLIIEKPFGHDLKSAQMLNEKLCKSFEEKEIYRIDHYLGKPMVQNLEALGFANPVLQSLWNRQYIANVQITASETIGVEDRADYYDKAGALRDMFQNHMFQLLMMTAMQIPKNISAEDIRYEKKNVMEALRPLKKENIKTNVIRGQYGPGEIHGEPVLGYLDEPGVEASSATDSFVAARLWIDNDSWSGVPFYIRTGKRMREKSTRIVIEFKNPLKDRYGTQREGTAPNLLVIEINPNESVSLQFNSKNPLNNGRIEPVYADFSSKRESIPEAYEILLYDAMRGDSTFFAHWNEVEMSWKWVQSILEAIEENLVPLHDYPSGSMGPESSHQLLAEDGFKWW